MKLSSQFAGLMACTLFLCPHIVSCVAASELSLQSEPRNVHIQCRGPLALEGVTPLSLQTLPPGEYLMRATGLGLVTARGRLRSSDVGSLSMQRWATPLAFLVPPGSVHMARHDAWRGALFTTATAGGVLGAIVKNAHLESARNDLELAQDAYDRAVLEDDIAAARLELEAAAQRESDEKSMRAIWTGYSAAVWAGAALEAWLLTSTPSIRANGAGNYVLGVRTATPWDAALRSAFVPGSGQRHLGHNWRGIAFGGSVLGFSAASIAAYDEYLQARRKQDDLQRRYDTATTTAEIDALRPELEKSADDTDEWQVMVWSFVGAAGAAYIWNILDAMGLGSAGWVRSSVEVGVAPQPDGLAASFTWRLP